MGSLGKLAAAARVRHALREEHGVRLAERAVAAGYVSAEQLADAVGRWRAGRKARPLIDEMVDAGLLNAQKRAALDKEIAREEFERPSLGRALPLPPEAAAVAEDPERNLPGFVLCACLGRGGTSEVWRAWDRQLGRFVAVKIPYVSSESASLLQRFRREALASAQLAHPNIVAVHQVGDHRGRPFLVMPYIDGESLFNVSLPLDRALEVMRTVAEAVEHAHRMGVIHRDIKPGNIMIGRDGRVFVLDFGLAYLTGSQSLQMTKPGDVLGTAAYMAPEQARGGAVKPTPAADVYGLGATLYHVVAGRPPFSGESLAEVVNRVIETEPPPPRTFRPDLPRDLETVIQKAMDKDPQRRYVSAGEMAADLARLVAGEPVIARPVSVVGRVARRVRRRPRIAIAALAAAVVVAVVAGATMARATAERRAAVEALRAAARQSLDTALRLRRAGDLAGMRAVLPQLEWAYDHARERAPRLAEVDYLMGRMQRVLMNDELALEYQDRALAKDPTFAPALYERVILRDAAYSHEVEEARRATQGTRAWTGIGGAGGAGGGSGAGGAGGGRTGGWRRVLLPDGTEVGVKTRTGILEDLHRLERLPLEEAKRLTLRGFEALYDGQPAEARDLLEAAVARDPFEEAAWKALIRAYQQLRSRGVDPDGARKAEELVDRAVAQDRGFTGYLIGRARERIDNGRYQDAIADATRGLEVNPDSPGARLARCIARTYLGHTLAGRGEAFLPVLAEAETDCRIGLKASPKAPDLWLSLGNVLSTRGVLTLRAGGDGGADLLASLPAYERAIAANRTDAVRGRGRTRFFVGLHKALRGEDPVADYHAAYADFARARARLGRDAIADAYHAEALAYEGLWRFERGGDATALFAESEDLFARAAEGARRTSARTFLARALLRTWRGRAERAAGRDAKPFWDGAAADFDAALAADPELKEARARRAEFLSERSGRARPATTARGSGGRRPGG